MAAYPSVEIALSKKKMILLLAGSLMFVVLGAIFILHPPRSFPVDPSVFRVLGAISLLFFGYCAYVIGRKFNQTIPGVIINDKGITDNSSGVSAGEVLWSDISEIGVIQAYNQKFLVIYVHHPEDYIARQTGFSKKAMTMNYRLYGSPVSLSANSLKCSFDELYKLVNERLEAYTSSQSAPEERI